MFTQVLNSWGFTKAAVTNTLLSASYLMLGAIGLIYARAEAHGDIILATVLAAVAAAGLLAWFVAHNRYRLIFDTPTSPIMSAAQGYVEIVGRCDAHANDSLLGFGPIPGCVWLQYTVHQRRGGEWRHLESRTSDDTFLLRDVSGTCILDPEGAEVVNAHRKTWTDGNYRHIARYLLPGDTLYALGEFTTLGGARTTLDKRSDVSALLREWKRDPRQILARFDSNGDGSIDVDEWESVRRAASQEVEKQHREARLSPDLHLLRAPQDGRPLLISNRHPDWLARRYRWWSWFHLGVFTAATVSVLVMWPD